MTTDQNATAERPVYCAAIGACWSRTHGYTPRACAECPWNAGSGSDYRTAVDAIALGGRKQ